MPSFRRILATATFTALAAIPAFGGLAATVVAPASAGTALPNGAEVGVFDSLALIRQTSVDHGTAGASLVAARNEAESFQVKVDGGTAGLTNISVELSKPLANGTSTMPAGNVRLYREDYATISTMSSPELASVVTRDAAGTCQGDCAFPDALIPAKDTLFNETRNAFPMTVPANRNRVVWVDLLVPSGQAAGAYKGELVVKSGATVLATVPMDLEVLNTTLPATSSTHSAFFLGRSQMCAAFSCATATEQWQQYRNFAALGLEDRISIVPEGFTGISSGTGVLGPLLGGTDSRVRLAGASLTDLPLNHHQLMADWKAALTGLGQAGKAWFYCDEVSNASCAADHDTALASFPGIKLLAIRGAQSGYGDPNTAGVAGQLGTRLNGAVALTQYLEIPSNGFLPGGWNGLGSRVSAFTSWRAANPAARQFWEYTSCMSAGCGAAYTADPQFTGWAAYGIDVTASEQRAMGWHMFRTGADGEVYWEADAALTSAWKPCVGVQPTNCPYSTGADAGMNGDGTLFYPYDQARVGGTTPIPVESMRLKRIRDGREDNELLRLAAAKGGTAQAQTIAASAFPALNQSAKTPAQFATSRAQLVSLVRSLYPTPVAPPATAKGRADLNCDGNADFLAVQTGTGNLLFYPRTATDWAPNAPVTVGSGFAGRYERLLLPGDVDGDGKPDVLGRKADGSIDLLPGDCTGKVGLARTVATGTVDPTAVGDFNGDGRPDLVDKRGGTSLWLVPGTAAGSFGPATTIGAGWDPFQIVGVGDADRDGRTDVLGRRSDGVVYLYQGNGTGGWKTGEGVATGVTATAAAQPQLLGLGDLDGDGKVDLAAIDSAGTLRRFSGDDAGHFAATGVTIGAGWQPASLAQVAR